MWALGVGRIYSVAVIVKEECSKQGEQDGERHSQSFRDRPCAKAGENEEVELSDVF